MEKLYHLDTKVPVYADPEDIKIADLMLDDTDPKAVVRKLKEQGYSAWKAALLVVLAQKLRRKELQL